MLPSSACVGKLRDRATFRALLKEAAMKRVHGFDLPSASMDDRSDRLHGRRNVPRDGGDWTRDVGGEGRVLPPLRSWPCRLWRGCRRPWNCSGSICVATAAPGGPAVTANNWGGGYSHPECSNQHHDQLLRHDNKMHADN